MSVPRTTVEQRKGMPLARGVLDYFPDALLVVAEVSRIGNEQHHPGEPMHWDKSKSSDEADALMRHLLDRGTIDTDGIRHSAKVAWRALALLQRELDAEAQAPSIAEVLSAATPYPDDGETAWDLAYKKLEQELEDMPTLIGAPDVSAFDTSIITTAPGYPSWTAMWDEFGPQNVDPTKFYPYVEWDEFGPESAQVDVTNRGEWPPDTRVGGLLTCCGQTEHPLTCAQYR